MSRITRSNKSENVPNKDKLKTPNRVSNTPTSSTKTKSDVTAELKKTKQVFICSICKNSEKLRSNIVSSSIESFFAKFDKANDTFLDSMSQIESLGLNLKHFLINNGDKAEYQHNSLISIEKSISELSERTIALQNSIIDNEVSLQSLDKAISDFRNSIKSSNKNEQNAEEENGAFSINSVNQRIIHKFAPLYINPTKHIDYTEENFLTTDTRTALCEYLNTYQQFNERGFRKTVFLGDPHKHSDHQGHKNGYKIPGVLKTVVEILHQKFSVKYENYINSIVIDKFKGTGSKLIPRSRNDPAISPDTKIYTLCLGDTCSTIFTDKCTGDKVEVITPDNSLYSSSSISPHYWEHEIPLPVLSDQSVKYVITFRSINRRNRNSTLVIGDSNTHFIRFHHENKNSELGKEIYGRRIKAYTIEEINPIDSIGYQNIVFQGGLNNMKNKYALTDGSIDIESTFDQWLSKLVAIKRLCPYNRIIASPIPPTKIRSLNDRARKFNHLMFTCQNRFWQKLRFDCFLDNKYNLLDDNFP